MECRKCNEDLTAYLDGELEAAVEEQIGRHLDQCPPCRQEYEELRDATGFVLTHAREQEPAPELWNKLRARVAEMPAPGESPGIFRFFVFNRWAAALSTMAATAVLAIGFWGYLQYQQKNDDLESSFAQYVESRAVTEQMHGIQLVEAESVPPEGEIPGAKTLENPFAEIRDVSFTNPFKSEGR